MNSWQVGCESCGVKWFRVDAGTEYERQSIESRPCPGCGAYTLACSTAKLTTGRRRGPVAVREMAAGVRRAG